MNGTIRAGLRLGAAAFLLGAVLGPVRELLLAPRIGGMAAALIEAALMLALLWWAAGRVLRPRPTTPGAALAAGLVAALAVVLAELLLGVILEATGLSAQRAPRGLAEQAVGLVPLAWLAVLPLLRREA